MSKQPELYELMQSINKFSKLADKAESEANLPGLSLAQSRTILSIARAKTIQQKEIAAELNCTSGNLVLILKNLTEKGLVTRGRTGDDRRGIYVTLTAEGYKVAKKLQKNYDSTVKKFVEDFGDLPFQIHKALNPPKMSERK